MNLEHFQVQEETKIKIQHIVLLALLDGSEVRTIRAQDKSGHLY
jgi:hypothetical protein